MNNKPKLRAEIKGEFKEVFIAEFGGIEQNPIHEARKMEKDMDEHVMQSIKRAPSARPLLRIQKAKMDKETDKKPPRPLRKFK